MGQVALALPRDARNPAGPEHFNPHVAHMAGPWARTHLGVVRGEELAVGSVGGGLRPVEEPGFSQNQGTGADRSDKRSTLVNRAQPARLAGVGALRCLIPQMVLAQGRASSPEDVGTAAREEFGVELADIENYPDSMVAGAWAWMQHVKLAKVRSTPRPCN